jgi:hypothetical protein
MKPGIYNFTVQQGSDFERTMVLSDEDGAVDLTGYTAALQIRPEVVSEEVMAELTTENGLITLGADGTITWTIPAATTALMTTDGVYDLDLINPSLEIKTYLKGIVRVNLEVTRSE